MAEQNSTEGYYPSTPLDLLLNVISGSDGHGYPSENVEREGVVHSEGEVDPQLSLSGLLESSRPTNSSSRKRRLDDGDVSPRKAKIARTLTSMIVSSAAASTSSNGSPSKVAVNPESSISRIEVWHPSTAQKSYGKERRMLNPPPMLRVSGPLFPILTSVTLSSIIDSNNSSTMAYSSQTHFIPLAEPLHDIIAQRPGRKRKNEREEAKWKLREAAAKSGFGASLPYERRRALARERAALAEGLAFSGLWVGDEVGKGRDFRLQVRLGEPGVEPELLPEGTQSPVAPAVSGTLDTITPTEHPFDLATDADQLDGLKEVATLVEHLQSAQAQSTPPEPASSFEKGQLTPCKQAWATLTSAPLTIVSKPSQKTAKARSMASCLTETDHFALWVRINSQTVRTKYMKLESDVTPQLTAKTGKWTPFRFEVIHRATPPAAEAKPSRGRFKAAVAEEHLDVLTYGSLVTLVDLQSGVRSEAVKLVKVELNEAILGADEGHPVSELQRVGLVREEVKLGAENRWYLSAPGARLGGGELLDPSSSAVSGFRRHLKAPKKTLKNDAEMPNTLSSLQPDVLSHIPESTTGEKPGKKRKTKRNALALATLAEDEDNSSKSLLSWGKASREEREVINSDGQECAMNRVLVDKVDDWMCWVIGGVSSFAHSFFDILADNVTLPVSSIDPVPHILADPIFHTDSNTLDLVLSDFFSPDPLDIYLGPIGPLAFSTWRSTAPVEKNTATPVCTAVPLGETAAEGCEEQDVMSAFPSTVSHVIVVVKMPDPEDIVHIMQTRVAAAREVSGSDQQRESAAAVSKIETAPWFRASEHQRFGSGNDFTIQQALKNAEAAGTDFRLNGITAGHLDENVIDPTLRVHDELLTSQMALARNSQDAAMHPSEAKEPLDTRPPLIALHKPLETERTREMVPLPLLLVRLRDGVGFGTGRSVEAERLNTVDDLGGTARWGLRVVSS